MKPILFSTEMVQAILEDRQTQTRLVMKPQPYLQDGLCWESKNRQLLGWYNKKEFSERLLESAPYQIGDILWVREPWAEIGRLNYVYKANYIKFGKNPYVPKWKSSRYMPKKAARIFLKVTNIRAGRLQEISLTDIECEGFDGAPFDEIYEPRKWYVKLWNSLNAKRGYGWDSNPWVWVIEFERIEKPEGAGINGAIDKTQ